MTLASGRAIRMELVTPMKNALPEAEQVQGHVPKAMESVAHVSFVELYESKYSINNALIHTMIRFVTSLNVNPNRMCFLPYNLYLLLVTWQICLLFQYLSSVSISCGSMSNENCTYFESSNNINTGMCRATICPCNNNICQVNFYLENTLTTQHYPIAYAWKLKIIST